MATPKNELLRQISEVSFVCDDVRLYLDTHTDDTQAQQYYLEHCTRRNLLMQEYTFAYGVLRPDVMYYDTHWTWTDDPWPWESEA